MPKTAVIDTGVQLERMVSSLLEMGSIDTLYHDLYLQRAADFLRPRLSFDDYRLLLRMQVDLANLPNEIRNAMGRAEWRKVQDLSAKQRSLKQDIEGKRLLQGLAKAVYEEEAIPLDPFSPGMQALAGTTLRALPELRQKGVRLLEGLIGSDAPWREFYADRLAALKALVISAESTTETAPSAANLQQEAMEALESGNFDKLQQVAGNLAEGTPAAGSATGLGDLHGTEKPPEDLDCSFPEESSQPGRGSRPGAGAGGIALRRVRPPAALRLASDLQQL